MEVAQWWIMEMKPNHFEKARKIISLIWLSYNTVNIRTVLSSVPLVTAKSEERMFCLLISLKINSSFPGYLQFQPDRSEALMLDRTVANCGQATAYCQQYVQALRLRSALPCCVTW